ncbi:AraC family transcriptional regulator [Flavobacterium ginsenosidimutans]|uniref:Helix-turn-helix transcriptional regulator n=1 Tax=Flavobacterium ginsenosidimutans TaxID=687844 RepID=A0ABZ2Q424_9FLAO|nr:helix-turn-helix transcriptional regulator [Flavobacterium ginsenosidimutans]KAF2336608.1 AraC family transcriptional regulator [Flavobacterium ginsenosidimutans]
MKVKSIPVNTIPSEFKEGIIIGKGIFNGVPDSKEVERSHRDGGYTFILQEKGTTNIEIDFQKQEIKESSVIFIHPDQVHRLISFEEATVTSWIITVENLRPEYLKLLEELSPVNTLSLTEDAFSILKESASLCLKLSERKHEKLYGSILKESVNTLVALIISQYAVQSKSTDNYSRFEVVAKTFKAALELNFVKIKRPGSYADKLNISTPYLNECVKTVTGYPPSYHIQQRVILEAKRLLHHSDKSIKEIASELGYDDYSYFARLFSKIASMSPIAFRNKNLD